MKTALSFPAIRVTEDGTRIADPTLGFIPIGQHDLMTILEIVRSETLIVYGYVITKDKRIAAARALERLSHECGWLNGTPVSDGPNPQCRFDHIERYALAVQTLRQHGLEPVPTATWDHLN
ncbi:hypothetical protein GF380_04495 [Candidatus Uhrbacteria bacterium]|nr:hypothetical protein [Candidatus Uhrbacteria bacterium]MBD3284319.1 hypothetical protein [Candidatus Uhrbacteria bacterium]